MAINRVTVVGNLTRDPELRGLPSGSQVCTLRIAVNERRKDQSGQWVDSPNFFNVTVFGAQAENAAKYLAKGRQVAIDGRLRWREWEDKNTGTKREAIEIVAQDVQFIGGRDGGSGGGGNYNSGGASGGYGGGGYGDQAPAGGGYNTPAGGPQIDQSDFGMPSAPAAAPVGDDDIPF